jgi:integrase
MTVPTKKSKDDQKPKKDRRSARGSGSIHYSEAKECWIWRAVIGNKPDGSIRYKEGRARTQTEALRKKQQAERKQSQPHEDKETVGEHLDHWLNDVAKPNTRASTWERYEQVVRLHLKPRVGGIPLRKLTVATVTKVWAEMGRENISAGNIKKCSEVLATALEVAVSEGKLPVAPTANAEKPKVIRGEIEVFTDDEVRAILKAAEGDRFEALYKIAAGTGAREGELLALEREDFDSAAGTVRIVKTLDEREDGFTLNPTKSKTGIRVVSLPGFAIEAVRKHLDGRDPGPVFQTKNRTYLSRTNFIRKEWKPLLKKAEVKYRKFHTLRHTHASRLLAAGVDPAEVAKRIGDRIETLMRSYVHWIPTTNRDTAAKVDAIYKEPEKKTAPENQGGEAIVDERARSVRGR